jgi:hypothetical protein
MGDMGRGWRAILREVGVKKRVCQGRPARGPFLESMISMG